MLREMGALLYPWPLTCAGCGSICASDDALCADCRMHLAEEAPVVWFVDTIISKSVAAHTYAGAAGEMVRLLKYGNCSSLANEMARDMASAAEAVGLDKPDMIAFVPMYWMRRHSKYFNQAELLAKIVARRWGMRPSGVLRRVRASRQQARISDAAMRRENVRNAFAVRGDVSGKRILLIDDVSTTGATATECARMLKSAGAGDVQLLVYAHTV